LHLTSDYTFFAVQLFNEDIPSFCILSRSDDVSLAVLFKAREPMDKHFRVTSATIDYALSDSAVATRRDGFTASIPGVETPG